MTTRKFQPAPATLIDPATNEPRYGTYVGGLPPVDFESAGASLLRSVARGKRWMYVIITSDELVFCAAVVRLGYASNAFAFAIDRTTGKPLLDVSALGPAMLASVGPRAGEGANASFRLGSKMIFISRPPGTSTYSLSVRAPRVCLDARLSAAQAPEPLSVIARLPNGSFSTTEKRPLLDVEGALVLGSKRYDLKGSFGGYDYTAGLVERHTAWKWAFAMGRSSEGKPIAYNLTQGFVGERECVAWYDGDVVDLSAARFSYDPADAMKPWNIRTETGAAEVDFDAAYAHDERHDLLVVKSRFLQVAGAYRGKLVLPNGGSVAFDNLPGVTEDQDTLW